MTSGQVLRPRVARCDPTCLEIAAGSGAGPGRLPRVFIASFPAGPWQTNCYLVSAVDALDQDQTTGDAPAADGSPRECVIIDPGVEAAELVEKVLTEQRLTPVAVVATHGHLDHIYAAEELCRRHDIGLWIHPDDRHLLTDPLAGIGPAAAPLLEQLHGSTTLTEPERVDDLADGQQLTLAGITFTVIAAPGHTAGCVMLQTPYPVGGRAAGGEQGDVDRIVFTGDVLFAGSIGRTDLPGGDHQVMLESLRSKVLPLADTAVLLPGHGPQTSMAAERASNPYLQGDQL